MSAVLPVAAQQRLGPRPRPRWMITLVVVTVLTVTLALVTLAWGSAGVKPADLLDALSGEADTRTAFVLERLRGPRLLTAVGAGVAFGLSGALFQSVTRNPLGSPDVIGLGAGAGAGVAIATLWFPGAVSAPVGALAGAAVAVSLVWWSTGSGFASPGRVILTGIGVFAMATAVTQYVVAVALRDSAQGLAAYVVGSLNARSMHHGLIIALCLVALLPWAVLLSRRLRLMDLGDDAAQGLGVPAVPTRTWAIILAVLLAAAAVSVAGPVAFVALTAPHIARRLVGASGPQLAASAAVGALLLVAADLAAQQVPVLAGLPVGIVTTGLGGLYLGFLLLRLWRGGRPVALS